jgi:hypothetical protein
MSLDKNLKFETGRELVRLSKSMLDFFNSGDRIAIFRSSGIAPSDKDKLMILLNSGTKVM